MVNTIAVGIRRLEHLPYFLGLMEEFQKQGYILDVYIDTTYCNTADEVKEVLHENGLLANEIYLISEKSSLIRFQKKLIGILVYLNESIFEHGYFLRQVKRAGFEFPSNTLILLRKQFPLFTTTLSKIATRILRSLAKLTYILFRINYLEKDYALVLVTPGNLQESVEDSLILEAGLKNIKSVVLALSFDNLNSKGSVIAVPDLYFAWNEHHYKLLQGRHLIPSEKVKVIGSPYFEKYANLEKVGQEIPPEIKSVWTDGKKLVCYLGSSANIFVNEPRFLLALLSEEKSFLKDNFLVIRPHPANFEIWKDWDEEGTLVFPKDKKLLERDALEDYNFFRKCDYCLAINTSGFIDAIACETPVFSILAREAIFQNNSSHHQYLITSGILQIRELQDIKNLVPNHTDIRETTFNVREKVLPNFGRVKYEAFEYILDLIDKESRAQND